MARLLFALILSFAAAALAQPDAGSRPRLAVLYFDASTTDPELREFSKGFASLLISDLAANDQLRVVERERLEDVMAELKLGETRFADKGSFEKVGQILGAQYLLVGTLLRDPSKQKVYVSARIISPKTSDTWGWGKIVVSADDVISGEDELVRKAAAKLVEIGLLKSGSEPPKKAYKLPAKTLQNYAKALEAKDKKDPETAKKLLGEVVKAQPDFALAQLDLSTLTK